MSTHHNVMVQTGHILTHGLMDARTHTHGRKHDCYIELIAIVLDKKRIRKQQVDLRKGNGNKEVLL